MSVAIASVHGIPSPPMSVYRRALAYYRPYLGRTVAAGGLTLLATGFNLLRPWPMAFIVDRVLPAVDSGAHGFRWATIFSANPNGASDGGMLIPWTAILLMACGAMVIFHLLASGLGYVINLLTIRASLMSLMTLRTEIYAWLHALPLKFHDQRRSADSSFRVAYDSQAIQAIYSKVFFIFQSSIALVSTFATMWYFDWQIAVLSLAVIPFLMLTIRLYAVRIRDESTVIAETESAVLTTAQEGISSVKMVQAFGREEHELAQFKTSAHASLEANLRFNSLSMRSSVIVGTLIALSTAAMIFVGARHVLDGTLKVGQLWYLSTLLLMLYQPLEALTHVAWALESAAAGAQRCFEVLDRRDDVPDRADAVVLEQVKGAVGFDQVSFGYDPERPILRDIDLMLDPGQTVAFVGGTGAGKSTLLSLVPRFYDPLSGRVLIDGQDVRNVTKKSLRRHISIVLQDTLLFSTTVRENIAYGRPGASEAEIIEAAQRAQAHEFIMEMPDGYRSQVGERGGHLSVGQRQRRNLSLVEPIRENQVASRFECADVVSGRPRVVAIRADRDQLPARLIGRQESGDGNGNDTFVAGATFPVL